MDGVRLADRLAYGAGCAARRVGFLHDVFRPDGACSPIDLNRRFMRLCVAYALPGGSVSAPASLGIPYRQAWADWSYLQVGDYLVGPEGTAFVALIEPPKPMLVLMTNVIGDIVRSEAPVVGDMSAYGGMRPETEKLRLSRFPACIIAGGVGDRRRAGLPDDTKLAGFAIILPAIRSATPQVGEIFRDDQARQFLISGVETIGGIWRLSVVQAVS